MVRQVAFLMRASKGALTHADIMKLTWRQFHVYLDSFTWLLREESEDGRKENRRDDLLAAAADPRAKAYKQAVVADSKRKLAEFDARWGGKKGEERTVMRSE